MERISVGCVSKYNEISGTLEAGHIRDLTEEEIAFFFKQKDKKLKDIENIFADVEKYNNISEEEIDIEEEITIKDDKPVKKHDKSKWAKAKPKKKRLSVKKTIKPKNIEKKQNKANNNNNSAKRRK